jgi:hypothetical protein
MLDAPHRNLLEAMRRRCQQEQGEPWKARALSLIVRFLRAADEPASPQELVGILDAAGRLPRDADGLREVLWTYALGALDRGQLGHLSRRAIAPGALVITQHGALAIVTAEAGRPTRTWLAEQQRPLRAPDGPFWTALVLDGGAVLVTAPDVYVVGEPDDDQIDRVLAMGTVDTARTLISVFPHLVARVQPP